jgi:hypothetical protein
MHVVFGHVVGGKEIVREIEDLDTDKKDRPLQDARIVNCGELMLKKKKPEKDRFVVFRIYLLFFTKYFLRTYSLRARLKATLTEQ